VHATDRFGNDVEAMDTRWSQLLESFLNQATMFGCIVVMLCVIVPQLLPVILTCICLLGISMATINKVCFRVYVS